MQRLLICIILAGYVHVNCNSQCSNPEEYTALRALYLATDGDNWINNTGWPDKATFMANPTPPIDTDMCSWFGIRLWQTTSNIGYINMGENNLNGPLPNELGLLSYLSTFRCPGNTLTGDLSAFTALDRLNTLDLTGSNVTGDLSSLSSIVLGIILLGDTDIEGELSSIPSSGMCSVHLENTNVSGDINFFQSMQTLLTLNLNNTNVTGSLSNLQDNPNLIELKLSNTGVQGDFSNLNLNDRLFKLELENLNISGCWPISMSALCNRLSSYNFDGNQGVISNAGWEALCSDGVGMCVPDYTALRALYLETRGDSWTNNMGWPDSAYFINNLVPSLDVEMSTWYGVTIENDRVSELKLTSNNLNGTIGNEIGLLSNLTVLELTNAEVDGQLSDLSTLANLEKITLINTEFQGDISSISGLTSMKQLFLSGTNIEGDLSAVSPMTQLQSIALSGLAFYGNLSSLSQLTSLSLINLRDTEIIGDISALENIISLRILILADMNISGALTFFESFNVSETLFLFNINVTGNLRSIRDLNVRILTLSNMNILGNIGNISNLPRLIRVDLSNTDIVGELNSLSPLSSLTYLDVSNLNLAGCWPASFEANCTSLTTYNFAGNQGVISNQGWQAFCADRTGMCVADCPDTISEVCDLRACNIGEGFYHAADSISYTGRWRVFSGNEVILNGGQGVSLTDEFEVFAGGVLEIETTGCYQGKLIAE